MTPRITFAPLEMAEPAVQGCEQDSGQWMDTAGQDAAIPLDNPLITFLITLIYFSVQTLHERWVTKKE